MSTPLDRSNPLIAKVVARLKVSDAVQTEEQLLAIVDTALEASRPKAFVPPAGQVLVDQGRLDELLDTIGRAERETQKAKTDRATALVQRALAEGRIAAFSAPAWIAQAEANEAGTANMLRDLPANQIPMVEIGHSDGPETEAAADDELFRRMFGGGR